MSEMAKVSTGRAQQAGQTAKQEASATAGQARQGAGEVVGTATEQVRAVTGEARAQAGAMAGDLRARVTEEADQQARRGAQVVRQWADDLSGLAERADADTPAKSLVAQVADRGHRAADYLDSRGVGGLVGDLEDFARRRPGAFLGGAVLAGIAVGRLAKAGGKANGSGPRPAGEPGTPGAGPEEQVPGPPGTAGLPEVAAPPQPPQPPGLREV
ncbi:hypothetical protein [Streptomyces sp. DSM 41921]|uniref:DUF3618 domain-containing protein n=1 Tax=Streptomyces dubilierae TaxID=3075533 RepID=A0ABU2PJV6_9ACTN|nr:hypothetical protein [Streptomyces sp. DSM 41921]MDT0391035.1 hypothetical protein [Streptomyces sp. DSM 41921]